MRRKASSSVPDVAPDQAHELELLRQVCGASRHEWVSVRRRDGSYVYVSPNCEALTGYTAQEIIADHLLLQRIIEPHDQWLLERHLTQEFEAHAPLLCVLRLIHRNGSVRWIEHTCEALFDAAGAWIGRRAVNRNITDTKALEHTLEESRRAADSLFQTLPYPAFIVDQEHCITAVNPPAQQLLGLREKEIIGQSCHQLLSGTVLPNDQCPLHQCLASGAITTVETHLAHTRNVFKITCAPLPSNNHARRALATLVDVSALHHARQSSEESEQRYRRLFEDMPVALLEEDFSDIKQKIETVRASGVHDFDDYCRRNPDFISACAACVRVRAMNKAARALWGVASVDEYVQQCGTMMTEIRRNSIIAMAAGQSSCTLDTVVHPRPGTTIPIQLAWTIAPGREATCDRVLLCAVDLAERQHLQNDLILAHKARAIEALAGGIAHEFNNLLTIISGNLALLLIDMAGTHPFYDKLKTMECCVEQGAEMTWRLLGFAHSGTLVKHPIDVNVVLQRNHMMLQRFCGSVPLAVVAADRPLVVDVDRLQIEQAVLYLLLHLVRELRAATLTLRACACTLTDDTAQRFGIAPGAYASMTLGAQEYAPGDEFAGDPSDTAAPTCAPIPIGISLAHAILKQHDGALGMLDHGAGVVSYRMLLPLSSHAVATAQGEAGFILGHGETILVVDDERHIITVAGMMLERLGYTPLLAQTAAEACQLTEHHRDEIKVVILDIIMPDTSCEELHLRLRTLHPHARFLLASGYAYNLHAVNALVNGCHGYIQKPLQLHTLATILHKTLTA